MNEAGITAQSNSRPAGIVFNRAMGELLRQYKLSDIDKGDRSRLLQMMQFRAEITEWHQGCLTASTCDSTIRARSGGMFVRFRQTRRRL